MEYATDIRRCSFPPLMWVDCVTKSKLRQRVSQWIVSNTLAGHVWTLEGTRVDAIKPQLDRLVSLMVTACSCRRESLEATSVHIVSFQRVSLVLRWSRLSLACKAQLQLDRLVLGATACSCWLQASQPKWFRHSQVPC